MEKFIRVKMPHGTFDIPAKIIADERAKYYAQRDNERGEDTYQHIWQEEFEYTMSDNSELLDWASNNTDWSDVERFAVLVETPELTKPDLNKAWINAERKVIER